MSTLYDQLGGAPAVDAAVERFYRKIVADERVSRFFAGVDVRRLAGHQRAFLAMAFGGPSRYRGQALRQGHAHLVARGLDDSHFDVVVELLGQTLTELGVAQSLVAQVAAVAETVRNDVLGRDARAA
jgi:hemoglobin